VLPLTSSSRGVLNRNLAVLAFTLTVLGLLSSFDLIPVIGSFLGSVMVVVGGTVLVCQLMMRLA
jgi:hypothetical protein